MMSWEESPLSRLKSIINDSVSDSKCVIGSTTEKKLARKV